MKQNPPSQDWPIVAERLEAARELILSHMRASSQHTVWPMDDDCTPDMYCGYLSFAQLDALAEAVAALTTRAEAAERERDGMRADPTSEEVAAMKAAYRVALIWGRVGAMDDAGFERSMDDGLVAAWRSVIVHRFSTPTSIGA